MQIAGASSITYTYCCLPNLRVVRFNHGQLIVLPILSPVTFGFGDQSTNEAP